MSTEQRSNDEFEARETVTEDPHPQSPASHTSWAPEDKTNCRGCGSHVTANYRRALGDEEDVAHACPNCESNANIYDGAASNPDFDPRVDGGAR